MNRKSRNKPGRLSPVLAATCIVLAAAAALTVPSSDSAPAAPPAAQSRELTLLSADVVNLENRVIEIQRTLDARDERVLGLVEQMADSVATLTSRMDSVTTLLDQVRQDTSGLGTGLSVAVRNLSDDMETMERNLSEVRADIGAMTQQLTQLSATSSELGDPDNVLRTARTDLSQQNFGLAREGFQDFLQTFPTSPRAAEAQMGLGNADYEEGLLYDDPTLFDSAILQFDIVLQRYPNSANTVDALHRKGLAQIELGNTAAARETFRRLIEEYPESIQALRAQEELDQLD